MKSIINCILQAALLLVTLSLLTNSVSSKNIEKDTNQLNLANLLSEASSEKESSFLSQIKSESATPLFQPAPNFCKKKPNLDKTFNNSFPRRKRDFYSAIGLNSGPIAYLMDYFEDSFKLQNKLIQSVFKTIFDDAKAQTAPADFKDPYPLLKLATGNPLSTETLANEELYQKWVLKDKKFNKDVYENSLTVGQVATILKIWHWAINKDNIPIEAKALVDEFDFDGDGRLNFREFIIALIIKTKNMVTSKTCTHCLEDIVLDLLEPMFSFLDCKQKGMINAEEMWHGLRYLNRKNPRAFDIYTCKVKDDRYRTSAVNDLILKAGKKILGFVNKKEFRVNVLIAFWDRYTTPMGIDETKEKLRKEKRWGSTGERDNVCEKIGQLIKLREE